MPLLLPYPPPPAINYSFAPERDYCKDAYM